MRARERRAPAAAAAACGPLLLPQEVDPSGAERDEERADDEADGPAAGVRGPDEECEPKPDRNEREGEDGVPIDAAHCAALPAATMTRTGACLSTKSTVSPKIARRPVESRIRRGPPMT